MGTFNIILIVLSILVGILIIISGILIAMSITFQGIIIGIFLIVFGLSIIILEIFFPMIILSWLGFYARWLGKGLFFVFLGCLILGPDVGYPLFAGIVVIAVGIVYIVLHFLPFCESPRPIMTREEERREEKA